MRDSIITGKERLDHILKAIAEIEDFAKDHTKQSFLKNNLVINATLFQFAIIGEAINYVDRDLLAKYRYPWHKVRGFRNFILHEYHGIEYRLVWDSIKIDLPALKKIVERILFKEFQG